MATRSYSFGNAFDLRAELIGPGQGFQCSQICVSGRWADYTPDDTILSSFLFSSRLVLAVLSASPMLAIS